MGRWEPDARGRLEEAALELYAERGYDADDGREIAERAGLTERTFFRHFADKREVLFGGGTRPRGAARPRGRGRRPPSAAPYDVVARRARGGGRRSSRSRREFAPPPPGRHRRAPELQERELGKLASLGRGAGRGRCASAACEPRLAGLVAQTGVAVFRVAFETWVADVDAAPLTEVLSRSFEELRGAASTTPSRRTPRRPRRRPPRAARR